MRASPKPGDLYSFPLPDGRRGLCVILGKKGADHIGCILEHAYAGAAPALEEIARLEPLIYRGMGDQDLDGKVMLGSLRLDLERDLARLGTIRLRPELARLLKTSREVLFLRHFAGTVVWSMARAKRWKPRAATAAKAPLLELGKAVRLIDDDGVVVLGSRTALAKRYSERDFEPDFPHALVEGMRASELVAWMTGAEGAVTLTVALGAPADRAAFRSGSCVRLGKGDALLAMPYSQYTMACRSRAGVARVEKGRCAAYAVKPGLYRADVRRAGPLRFEVRLVPVRAVPPKKPTDVLRFDES